MSVLPFLSVNGSLQPITPEGEALVESLRGRVEPFEHLTPQRLKTRQQERYWWGPVLGLIVACWKSDPAFDWSISPSKDHVHDAFMRAVFGTVQTPMGEARNSSTKLTLEQYGQLIEAGGEHLMDKYKVPLPPTREGEL